MSGLERIPQVHLQTDGPCKGKNQTSMESVLRGALCRQGSGTSISSATQVQSHQGAGIPEPGPTLGFLRAPCEKRHSPGDCCHGSSWQADSLPLACMAALPASGTFSSCSLKRPLLSTLTASKNAYSPLPSSSFTKLLKVQCLMSHYQVYPISAAHWASLVAQW